MFLKPFRVKSQTAIKGSDRKKLRADISRQFGIDSSLMSEIIPSKDEMTVMKIYLHSGETAVVFNIMGNPSFFEVNRTYYPSVYTLWKYPDLLPVFTTWPPVFKKITGGADLMLPGVIVKADVTPTTFGKLQKGDACVIKLLGNKAPVAVGVAALSGSDMYESAMRGKGVIVYHMYTDQLWAFGDKSPPPQIDDPEALDAARSMDGSGDDQDPQEDDDVPLSSSADPDPELLTEADNKALANPLEGNGQQRLDDAAAGVEELSLTDITGSGQADQLSGDESREEDGNMEEAEREDPKAAQERMDDLLNWCCLCAIKSRVKKSDLPLLTSTFFRNFLQPCCPSGKSVDVKKSSYKKLSKFLKAMQDQGLLRVKELSKGVESIVEISRDHLKLREFVVPETPTEEQVAPSCAEAGSEFVPPEIMEVFVVNAAVTGFFRSFGYSKGSDLTAGDVRKCLTDYVKEHELTAAHKGLITLDATLSDLVLNKGEYLETVRWEELMTRVMNKMSNACRMTFSGHASVIKKGKLEPITFNIAQRGGNKKVTLIHGLEVYGLDPQELAHRVQIAMACSTAVTDRPGKNQGKEVLVQGNQINYVANLLLDTYKIPRKYITGLEKAPKSGKKR